VSGRVDGFRNKSGRSLSWSDILLTMTPLEEGKGVFQGVASQDTEMGTYKGAFVGMDGMGMQLQPTGVSGTYGVGNVIGAFGARQ